MWRQVWVRARALWRWRRRESELDEEIRFHLDEEMEERIAAGMPPEQARAAARRHFGNVELIRELTRETWGWGPVERFFLDIRAAVRGMRRNPGYASAVIITLALGIGLNAAMYGLLSRLFLQAPPHIEDPDGIHRVWLQERGYRGDIGALAGAVLANDLVDWAEFQAFRDDADRFAAVAGYTAPRRRQSGGGPVADDPYVSWVTGELFVLLGARPVVGRAIGPEDDDPVASPVAVIGDGYAQRRFGGARNALGATLAFDDITYVIVGVMPPGFSGPEPSAADVWLPLQIAATGSRGDHWQRPGSGFTLTTLVRLVPGITATVAEASATGRVQAARADLNLSWKDVEATVVLGPIVKNRGPAALGSDMQLPLVVGGVALVVLLVATANVSNLLVLRVAARRRELAVRNALGAGRWGVGRLLVIESLVLAALSGAAALGVAAVAGRVLRVTLLPRYHWASEPLDVTAITFTGATVLVVGLAAALFPAVYAARGRGIAKLDALRGVRSPGVPVRTGLVVVQVALSLLLLHGTAVFFRSFEAARQLDIGYAKEDLLMVLLADPAPLVDGSLGRLEARMRALPGVVDVAQTTHGPLQSATTGGPLRAEGHDRLPRMNGPFLSFVTPNFFRVAGLGIREGREFTGWDREGTQRVAIVNDIFAQLVWPNRDAVGRCLFVGVDATDCTTVVGVVESALEFGLRDSDRIPLYYLPIAQGPPPPEIGMQLMLDRLRTLVVRTVDDPARTVPPVRDVLAELLPHVDFNAVFTLADVYAPRIRSWTIGTGLFAAAAFLGLLLAALGLYTIIAFGVRRREAEFAIRLALGARPSDVLRMVLRRGVALTLVGIAVGAFAALSAGRFVAPLLFDGRSPRDLLALGVAAAVMVTVALAASFFPARRASRADPREALQAE